MKRRSEHRTRRVATLIKEALAEALATKLKDPRIGFITVTGVRVSSDCAHAHITVSVMGTEEEKVRTMSGLTSAGGFLRTYLSRTLTLRSTPELHFHIDRGLQSAARIDAIFDELNQDAQS